MAIQPFNQIGDFPCGDSFSIKCDDGRFQIVGSPGIIRDQLLIEVTIAVTGNRNVELSVFGVEFTGVIAIAAVSGVVSFHAVFFISEELGQLDLKKIVDRFLKMDPEKFIQRLIFQ